MEITKPFSQTNLNNPAWNVNAFFPSDELVSKICGNTSSPSFPSIITNLVDNAIKYSLDPKNIYIDLIRENEFITFKISDNGCGISDKDKVNVFTKFFRAENENIRNSKGTGLGLYIVKQIVKGHKGEIVVKNNLPKGITFEIKLNEA